jgi:hypothetical protein
MRPLTFGELLDAAVSLLRAHAPLLLGSAFVLAVCEQALLYPPRSAAGMRPPLFSLNWDDPGPSWLVFCFGMATEGTILALLGAVAGTAAGPALLGQPTRTRQLLGQALRRTPGLLVVGAVTAVLLFIGALVLMLPWPVLFGMLGLAGPALIVDRIGPWRALGRSFRLSSIGMRGVGIRLGGYLSWFAIRLALGYGGFAVIQFWLRNGAAGFTFAVVAIWVLVDTVAYATLACIDAVLYLEIRMRVEGLDVAIGRLRRLDRPIDLANSVILGAAVR